MTRFYSIILATVISDDDNDDKTLMCVHTSVCMYVYSQVDDKFDNVSLCVG